MGPQHHNIEYILQVQERASGRRLTRLHRWHIDRAKDGWAGGGPHAERAVLTYVRVRVRVCLPTYACAMVGGRASGQAGRERASWQAGRRTGQGGGRLGVDALAMKKHSVQKEKKDWKPKE